MTHGLAVVVRRNMYVDSVTLLQVTADVVALPGVSDAALVMATELNRDLLRESGLLRDGAEAAGANDLVIAVRATDDAAATAALERADALLSGRRGASAQSGDLARAQPRSLRSAHRAAPDAQLALISVPGAYAAAEARQALAEGLHVFLFSDNVSLEDEIALKRCAREQDLLVMGPDCGTAILGGVGLGFANLVRRGTIGVVGASGTGIQEVSSLIHRAGQGISHAIGTGSHDLHAAVGGITTLQAIELLGADAGTQSIVLVSKPSDAGVAAHVLSALAGTGKRAIAYLQGSRVAIPAGVQPAATLEQAAEFATGSASELQDDTALIAVSEGQVRGLFCGGTLCQEAAAILGEADQQLIDFGDDEYTHGRAHPMIDPTLRNQAIVQAGHDPRVGVVLLDFILGLGSHADPAGAALPAIREALAAAASDGRDLTVIAHVVGTDGDSQNLARQEAALRSVGVHVFGSNARAASAASVAVRGALA